MNYFDTFTSKYDMQDLDINYKYYHSYRVMNNMKILATNLNISKKDIKLAEVIGLLHDIGRFEQDKLYNSFIDNKMDHATYGVKILKDENLLSTTDIDKEDYEIVYKAIQNHNKYKIDKNLTKKEEFFTKLLRDADKLDILYAINNGLLGMLKQDDNEISEKIKEEFFTKLPCNKQNVKNKNDSLLICFGYIYDINFKETFKIIKENNYYNQIYEKISRKDIFKPYIEYTNKYIEERLD